MLRLRHGGGYSKRKAHPTDAEKEAFIKSLAAAENPKSSAEERKAAKAQLQEALKKFDCGCSFRDRLFKDVYQQVRAGNTKAALNAANLFARSFKYDSLKGIMKGLGF